MARFMTIALLTALFGLSACSEPGTYPLGEGQCKPTDPVLSMDANDCMIPGT